MENSFLKAWMNDGVIDDQLLTDWNIAVNTASAFVATTFVNTPAIGHLRALLRHSRSLW